MQEKRNSRALGSIEPNKNIEIVVVLVEPQDARNIGSVARAMSNLGVLDLRLVKPASFEVELAERVSCWGEHVVEARRVFESLGDAVADCTEVVGFASDSGKHRVSQMVLEQWVDSLPKVSGQRIALVFGSEVNGLSAEDFPLCQYLVRIPSVQENPSYNLAQSVVLALYALQMGFSTVIGEECAELPQSRELENLTQMVLRLASEVAFTHEHAPAHIKDLIVNVTRRGRMTTKELKVITGLCGMVYRRLNGS